MQGDRRVGGKMETETVRQTDRQAERQSDRWMDRKTGNGLLVHLLSSEGVWTPCAGRQGAGG